MSRKHSRSLEVPRGRWREEQARPVLRRWRESGQSASAFARAHGLNPQRLLWWRKRLEASKETALAPLTFIPAEVTGGVAAMVLRLPGGVMVELSDVSGVPASWISDLVAELKGRS